MRACLVRYCATILITSSSFVISNACCKGGVDLCMLVVALKECFMAGISFLSDGRHCVWLLLKLIQDPDRSCCWSYCLVLIIY